MEEPSRPEPRIRLTAGLLGRAAVVSAQLIVIFAALWVLRNVVSHLGYVLIPIVVTLLLSAVLEPLVGLLVRHRWPRPLAVLVALFAGLAVVGGLVTFVVFAVRDGIGELQRSVSETIERVQNWLSTGPFGLDGDLLDRARQWVEGNQQALLSRALGVFSTAGAVAAGLVLSVVLLVMFLYDGPRMWQGLLRPWRPGSREMVDEAGRRAYRGVVQYVWVTALVALIDAVGIAIGLAVVGVPLVVPLAAVVFLGGFVPYVGAFVSGFLAIAVALVSNGPVAALIILGVVIAVQQLEGQVLQPVLQGNVSRLHPVVVLLALVVGGAEGGIPGVLFAVPLVTAVRAVVLTVAEHRRAD